MTKMNYVMALIGAFLALILFNPPVARNSLIGYALIILAVISIALFYTRKIKIRQIALGYMAYFTVFTAIIFYALPSYAISQQTGTILNDNWWAGLNWIRENTESCAMIATYWDPGHFIRAISERPVVFDGASQNSQITLQYNGTKQGFEIVPLDHDIKELVLYRNDQMTRSRIKDIATIMMTSNETLAVELLKDYRGDCSETYFLASQDLVYKSVWWSYFATWDPLAKDPKGMQLSYVIVQRGSTIPIQSLGTVGYSYPVGDGSFILCQNNSTVSPCTGSVIGMYQAGNQFARLRRMVLTVPEGFRLVEDKDVMEGRANGVGGTIFVLDPQGSQLIYMPEDLESSIFTRMFFFNGIGLEKFQLVGNWGNEFKLYKVKFD